MRSRGANYNAASDAQPPDEVKPGGGVALKKHDIQTVFALLVYEVAFYFAYDSGMAFSQTIPSPFWLPDSILLCALLVSRPQLWWILVLLPLPVRLFSDVASDVPLWFLLTTFWIDSLKGLAAALVLRRFIGPVFHLDTVRNLAVFFAVAVVIVPAVSAVLGAGARTAFDDGFWPAWEQWFLGNVLTQTVATPAIFYWGLRIRSRFSGVEPRRYAEAVALALSLIVTGYFATNVGSTSIDFAGARFYLPIPFMFWAAIRFGMPGASGAIGIIALLSIRGALNGDGPFSTLSPPDITLALQNFLLLRSAPLYLVAAVIAQRKATDDRLRESEGRFRQMANSAPVLLWICRPDLHCEFVNQGWLEFTGRSLEEVTGEGWLQDLHDDDRHAIATLHAGLVAQEQIELEYRLRHHDGDYRWIMHKCAPRYAPDGSFLGYIGSAVDMTERRQIEEGTRHLSHTQRLVVMGELSAAIAHEVRQPLSAILSNADAAARLLDEPSPSLGEIREIVSDIRKDDLRANDIVSRVRSFVRNETTDVQALNVNEIVADVIRFIGVDARRRWVQLRSDLAADLPAVLADKMQLQQVFMNLMVNGLDAMESTPAPARVMTIRTRMKEPDVVEVAVTDRGVGIPPAEVSRLFEPFYSTKPEGMGLGLSIARTIITAHRGTIRAENNPDGGATVCVTLPVATPTSGVRLPACHVNSPP